MGEVVGRKKEDRKRRYATVAIGVIYAIIIIVIIWLTYIRSRML